MYKPFSHIYTRIKQLGISMALTILFANPFALQAQNNDLDNLEEVIVVAPYNPNIHPASAIPESPHKDTTHNKAIPMPYIQSPQAQLQKLPIQNIKAIEYKLPKAGKHFQNYARLGYGTRQNADAEALLNTAINDIHMGAYIKHLSANPKLEERSKAQYANSKAQLFAQWGEKDWQSVIKLNFARQMRHYHGFNTAYYPHYTQSDVDSMKQIYTQGGLAWHAYYKVNKRSEWDIKTQYDLMKAQIGAKEHLISANIDYKHKLNGLRDKQINYWGLSFSSLINHTDFIKNQYWQGAHQLKAFYAWQQSDWSLSAGAELLISSDDNSKLNIAPHINLLYSIPDIHSQLFVSSSGKINNNNLHRLSTENPFISPIFNLKNTRTPLNVKIGIRGNLFDSQLDYEWHIGYAQHISMPLFILDSASRFNNSFEVVYDNVSTTGTELQLAYNYQNWEAHSTLRYTHYSSTTQEKAWHKAPFILRTRLYYNMNKWRFGSLIECQSKRYAYITWLAKSYQLNAWADISLLADYQLNQHLSLYMHINNLLNTEYSAFSQYRVQGFGALAGLKFIF